MKEIAAKLGISQKTAESHKASGMERMGFTGRVQLIQYALKVGWLRKQEENCDVQ